MNRPYSKIPKISRNAIAATAAVSTIARPRRGAGRAGWCRTMLASSLASRWLGGSVGDRFVDDGHGDVGKVVPVRDAGQVGRRGQERDVAEVGVRHRDGDAVAVELHAVERVLPGRVRGGHVLHLRVGHAGGADAGPLDVLLDVRPDLGGGVEAGGGVVAALAGGVRDDL